MSLSNEGDRLSPTDQPESSITERTIEELTNFIKGESLQSARFQAFADHADYTFAESKLRRSPQNAVFQMEFCLIQETKRQRKNGVRGYKREYEQIEKLSQRLGASMQTEKNEAAGTRDISAYLGYIRNSFIDEEAQRP